MTKILKSKDKYIYKDDHLIRMLSITAFAVHSIYNTVLKATPDQLVSIKYLIFHIEHIYDW